VLRRDAKVDLLKRVPLFAPLSKSELRKIAAVADEYRIREGRTLVREGDKVPRDFVVIVDGHALVERKGRRVNRLGPGDFFGEIALLTDRRRTATVTAVEPVHALVLRERDFRRLVKTTPVVALKVLQALGRRLPDDEP
jgi:CRP/FNR family transcriptional regulator, cyclic AMP receptor protein